MTLRLWLRCAAFAGFLSLLAPSAWGVQARIVDATTGDAIAGAMITLGTRVLSSDGGGSVEFADTSGQVFVRAPGYRAGSFDLGGLPPLGAALRLVPFTPKALYLTVYGIGSDALRNDAIALLQQASLNALVIDIKGDRGYVPYPSEVALVKTDGARKITTIANLAALVQMLHEKGIYAIARIVTFKDQPLASSRPDLAVKLVCGALFHDREGLAWTDPFLPEVRQYNIDIAIEAAKAGFDEVQFDYLRFPNSPQPLLFAKPTNQESRLAEISGFLAEARRQLLPYNVYLAADIFGYTCWNLNDTGIGQRLEEIAPNVDYLSPMLYPSGFQFGIPGYRDPVSHSHEIVYLSLEKARARLNISPKRFRPWLQAFKDYAFDRRIFDATEVAAQIKAATEFGSDGWMLWNPWNTYEGRVAEARAAHMPQAGLPQSSSCS